MNTLIYFFAQAWLFQIFCLCPSSSHWSDMGGVYSSWKKVMSCTPEHQSAFSIIWIRIWPQLWVVCWYESNVMKPHHPVTACVTGHEHLMIQRNRTLTVHLRYDVETGLKQSKHIVLKVWTTQYWLPTASEFAPCGSDLLQQLFRGTKQWNCQRAHFASCAFAEWPTVAFVLWKYFYTSRQNQLFWYTVAGVQ